MLEATSGDEQIDTKDIDEIWDLTHSRINFDELVSRAQMYLVQGNSAAK